MMSLPESLGLLLAVLGLVLAFEAPRHWIVKVLRLSRKESEQPEQPEQQKSSAHAVLPPSLDVTNLFIEVALTAYSPITVEQIVTAINSAPPFQRDELSTKYNGILVLWQGYLREARTAFHDKDSVTVNLNIADDSSIGYSFWFSEKLAKFPDVQTLPKGAKLEVAGRIVSASGPGISVSVDPLSIRVLRATQ